MTPFAKKVYKAVLLIPLAQTRTYKWVAKKAGSPFAWRSVGTILKNNPYPLIIPCHRVVAEGGRLGGYIFGIKRKKLLLESEKKILQALSQNKAAGQFNPVIAI